MVWERIWWAWAWGEWLVGVSAEITRRMKKKGGGCHSDYSTYLHEVDEYVYLDEYSRGSV